MSDFKLHELRYLPPRKYITPKWRMVRLGCFRLLLVRPDERAYGRFIADIAVSMWVSLTEKSSLYLFPALNQSVTRTNPALLLLKCRGVRVFQSSIFRNHAFKAIWSIAEFFSKISFRFLNHSQDQNLATYRPYTPRKTLKNYLPTYLSRSVEKRAISLMRNCGIDIEKPIVALHVRESGHDVADSKDAKRLKIRSRRNADFKDYVSTVKYLVNKGYIVVRLGDPHMSQINLPGVIDLPHVETDYGLVELYTLMKSKFFIATDSGPWFLPFLTSTPLLLTNATLWWINFPLRQTDMYLLKDVFDRQKAQNLNVEEILGVDFTANDLDLDRFEFIDNNQEEILAAVQEMEELVFQWSPMNPEQENYQSKAHSAIARIQQIAGDNERISDSMKNWGPDDGFLGDGRIAKVNLSRYALR